MKNNVSHTRNSSSARSYSFQGQERDDEIKGSGNSINYKYRMHDPRLGRFFAVDPLSPEYLFYSPYSFSGNRVIDAIELEGLEPADYKEGAKHLVIVVIGYQSGGPSRGKTQIKRQSTGLTAGFKELEGNTEIQVVYFEASLSDMSEEDIAITIENFKRGNPDGSIILAGHSLGSDNLVETLNDRGVGADLLISLDLSAGPFFNDEETLEKTTNIPLVLGFYQNGSILGGNLLDSENSETNVVNLELKNISHDRIDNEFGAAVTDLVLSKISGATNEELVKKAKHQTEKFNKKR